MQLYKSLKQTFIASRSSSVWIYRQIYSLNWTKTPLVIVWKMWNGCDWQITQ